MSLDYAEEAFTANPTPATAEAYWQEAVCYNDDDMISDMEVELIWTKVEPYLSDRGK